MTRVWQGARAPWFRRGSRVSLPWMWDWRRTPAGPIQNLFSVSERGAHVHLGAPNDHIHRGCGGRRIGHPSRQDVFTIVGAAGNFTVEAAEAG